VNAVFLREGAVRARRLGSFVAGWLLALCASADGLTVVDGYVREMPPGQNTTAGYFTLVNDGDQPVVLAAATSPVAARAELHSHRQVDGVVRMEWVQSLEVPARGRLVLEPGGYHLMLIDLKRPLRAGEVVDITLLGQNGDAHPMRLPVVDMRQPAPARDHNHHH
jgi:copper(I)-binding protein